MKRGPGHVNLTIAIEFTIQMATKETSQHFFSLFKNKT